MERSARAGGAPLSGGVPFTWSGPAGEVERLLQRSGGLRIATVRKRRIGRLRLTAAATGN
ncbi:hypothetical protein E2562_030920 [Oryza meyeriana var. granulata]|uniref:Uncharacterized protein n=1 Tax=Oryza meyeriana var. granulata TaxID=110450 RepID=A0A6G1E4G4_9ORYZ|nr:hypothetical protein E2562_030920 [Oryza meyeriana var. granulata]